MFPSDRYLLETQAQFHGFDPDDAIIEVAPREGEMLIREEDILDTIAAHADELALVFFGGVNYFTGQLFNLQRLTAAAHAAGAVAGFDLAHAAGNVPLSLHDWNVDFAAWCSYKYLNSSPGNVGAIFVHERHGRRFDLPRFGGWWGHDKETRFQMKSGFQPMEGAEGWQLSNVPILGMAAMKASLDVFAEAGMPALREKSERLTAYLECTIDAVAEEFPDARISLITPRDPEQRGCQISIDVAGRERKLFDDMVAAGVIADFREPCVIRMAPVPLYNSFTDVFKFGRVMRALLANGESGRAAASSRSQVGGRLARCLPFCLAGTVTRLACTRGALTHARPVSTRASRSTSPCPTGAGIHWNRSALVPMRSPKPFPCTTVPSTASMESSVRFLTAGKGTPSGRCHVAASTSSCWILRTWRRASKRISSTGSWTSISRRHVPCSR